MAKTYDSRCLELAAVFIAEYKYTPADLDELAWVIQDAIETYTRELEPKLISPSA